MRRPSYRSTSWRSCARIRSTWDPDGLDRRRLLPPAARAGELAPTGADRCGDRRTGAPAGALARESDLLGIRTALIVAGSFLPLLALVSWRRLAQIDAATVVPEHQLALLRANSIYLGSGRP